MGETNLDFLMQDLIEALGPDLVHKGARKNIPVGAPRCWGCCYIATEALYYLYGKDHGFYPWRVKHEGWNHWYLMREDDMVVDAGNDEIIEARILDPTYSQFKTAVPYFKGRKSWFLTPQPCKRTKILMGKLDETKTKRKLSSTRIPDID
jgi:hypothetical protein